MLGLNINKVQNYIQIKLRQDKSMTLLIQMTANR